MLIGVGIFVLLVGYVVYQGVTTTNSNTTEEQIPNQELTDSSYAEQKDETGPVTVTIKPVALPENGDWEFAWTLQTHSVDLSMDIIEAVVLITGDGSEMKPTSWDGDPPGGHHRTGTVRFTAPDPPSESIVVQVKNVAGVPVREFNWVL